MVEALQSQPITDIPGEIGFGGFGEVICPTPQNSIGG